VVSVRVRISLTTNIGDWMRRSFSITKCESLEAGSIPASGPSSFYSVSQEGILLPTYDLKVLKLI
jgi:hypothetical protein